MSTSGPQIITTSCCIAGGGPAGIMLGFLLARGGIDVLVLEKHADFLRDFRGDTLHPSTLELLREVGLLEELLQEPHQKVSQIGATFRDGCYPIADFTHLPTYCKFIALMPQWDFLSFLARQGKRYPTFHLLMESEVTDLITENGRISGVRAKTPTGELEIHAQLVIGADGRRSTVRQKAGLQVIDLGAPIDVLWFRLSKEADDPQQSLGYIGAGQLMIMIDRGDYWQCGFVIPKGSFDQVRQAGLPEFRSVLTKLAPFLASRSDELETWERVRLLTVKVDRLHQWQCPGLLCIGDAAHAMSPIGGVGVNLAIQDAVAAANLLYEPLRRNAVTLHDLEKVQKRRTFPTRMTQGLQVFLHQHVLSHIFETETAPNAPWLLRLLTVFPVLRRIPARLIGVGFRAEHIHTPEAPIEGESESLARK